MSSLKKRIEILEEDLRIVPSRISFYNDLPFAIFRYDPKDEWELRREVSLLATRLDEAGKKTRVLKLSDLLWEAIQKSEGIDAILELEKSKGYLVAQRQITTYLSDKDWQPLSNLLSKNLAEFGDLINVVFLTRAASMSPGIYLMSKLLDQMHGKTSLTTVLFYPGSIEGTTGLRFMDLKDRDALGNYRVKIYS